MKSARLASPSSHGRALPPPASSAGDKPGDGIDANASSAANISLSLVMKFREHLKSCSKLPASVARSDNIFVKLRVVMTPQARLAVEPEQFHSYPPEQADAINAWVATTLNLK